MLPPDQALTTSPVPPAPARRILVVDDELSMRTVMSIVLGKLGHSVQVTSGPEEALRVFGASTEHPFDLLITDLVMPTMTGTELARKILEQAPSTKVIYTSGLSAARAAELGVDPQHDCYLQKPVTLAGMRETITAVLAK